MDSSPPEPAPFVTSEAPLTSVEPTTFATPVTHVASALPGTPESSTIHVTPSASAPRSVPVSSAASMTSVATSSAWLGSPVSSLASMTPTPSRLLEEENSTLKAQLKRISMDYKTILDHAVENDTRLMKFTDKVFVANIPQSNSTERPNAGVVEQAVQCDLSTGCQDERCAGNASLILSLKTSLEVLEAEIVFLKTELSNSKCQGCMEQLSSPQWTESIKKRVPLKRVHRSFEPTRTHNRFEPLVHDTTADVTNIRLKSNLARSTVRYCDSSELAGKDKPWLPKLRELKRQPLTQNRKQHRNKTRRNPTIMDSTSLAFPNVEIHGDSHARHIAGLTKELVGDGCKITGICKPSAGLKSIIPSTKARATDCIVLMGGSNDVAGGRQSVIYDHLEDMLTRHRQRRVVMSTIPYRYDLPLDHIINDEVVYANYFIEDVASRNPHVTVMDINRITRRHFTRHGQHLGWRGKRELARLVVSSLRSAAQPTTPPPDGGPPHVRVPVTPSEPYTLPHDSYADAVKVATCVQPQAQLLLPATMTVSSAARMSESSTSASSTTEETSQQPSSQSGSPVTSNQTVFLGTPLHSGGQN